MNHRKKRLLFPFLLVCLFIMSMSVSAGESERFSAYAAKVCGLSDAQTIQAVPYNQPAEAALTVEDSASSSVRSSSSSVLQGTTSASAVTEATNSELNSPQKWSLKLDGRTLSATYKDSTVDANVRWQIQVYKYGSVSESKPLKSEYTTIADGKLSIDLSNLANGTYDVYLMRGDTPQSTSVKELVHYTIRIADAGVQFVSANYASESSARQKISSNTKPEWYNQVPAVYYTNSFQYSSYLSKITALAKRLTANASGNEAKLLKIHDWICQNISYDYDAAAVGYVDVQKQNNPFYVYKYKRGVCGGYARLMEIMLTSVGVPCLYIEGHGDDGSGSAATVTNHAWNMVWIGGAWRYMDVTWDCRNVYENAQKTTAQKTYSYYGTPMFFFANDHASHSYGRYHLYVKKLSVYSSPKKSFTKGSKFSVGNGVLKLTFSDGSTTYVNMTSSMCSGYKKNVCGKQTIRVSYGGGSTTYTINVIPKKGSAYTVNGVKYRITKASASKGTVSVAGVSNAKNVVIPKKVTIKGYSFKVTGIASNAFKKCTKVKKLTIETLTLKTVEKNALSGIRGSAKIYVPKSKYTSYKKLLQKKGQSGKVSIKKVK